MSREKTLETLAAAFSALNKLEKQQAQLATIVQRYGEILTREGANELYNQVFESQNESAQRWLCLNDLFFLLTRGCKRIDMDKDWIFARCREVQASPDGHLDLWAREHYKSTIITFGLTIQGILKDPEKSNGIFSHTRGIAKGFLDQIKREFEANQYLIKLFPDVLYEDPRNQAPKWSLDSGIIIKRKTNPKEATVEAWGLVDGQPTSKHFDNRIYDDVVTLESVTTPEQIRKTTAAWEMSINLGARGGSERYIGTRYHANDTYRTMMERGAVKPRVYPATDNGKMDEFSKPVLLDMEDLQKKRTAMGPYTFGTQMLQNPVADNSMGFKEEWLMFYENIQNTQGWNIYILVDPSSGRKKTTGDYSVFEVIGLAPDNNYYLLEGFRDRLNLTQRAKKLFELHRKYNPRSVGYEQYGMQADIDFIKVEMERQNYRFGIIELGGMAVKEDRIKKLVPIFEQKRFFMPKTQTFINHEGKPVDYVKAFIDEEYKFFPVSTHDDMLDCRARILDPVLGAVFPKKVEPISPNYFFSGGTGFMG